VHASEEDQPILMMLEIHELTGPSLHLKVGGFQWFRSRFMNASKASTTQLKWLHKALAAANSILGSLGQAIPAAAAVAEFKDALELVILKQKSRRANKSST
jgi:hypothetical protein